MRARLLRAPAWVLALLGAAGYAGCLAVASGGLAAWGIREPSAPALLGGAVVGAAHGLRQARANRRELEAAGPLAPELLPAADRAAVGGPVPADDRVRRAAAGLAAFRRDELDRQAVGTVLGCGLFAVVFGVLAFRSPWAALPAALAVAELVRVVRLRPRLDRRARLLADPAAPPARPTSLPPWGSPPAGRS